ncbi:hypothetical protein [Verrucosispora sp. TAA-831]|uniref:hypothetical protein n=1 Tax=Verrucosispora sp. TAA-831 TaxID=3422227 RepID=UPI003D6F715D
MPDSTTNLSPVPRCPIHGEMAARPGDQYTAEQRVSGTWYDCRDIECDATAVQGEGGAWIDSPAQTPAAGTREHAHIPGAEGSVDPFPGQYGGWHVYARDVHSGAGNCVCGQPVGDRRHVEAAPGVPVPAALRW